MSKRKDRNRCGNKVKHKTLDEAKTAAIILAKKKNIVTFMNSYKCGRCGFFHFGNSKSIDWSKL